MKLQLAGCWYLGPEEDVPGADVVAAGDRLPPAGYPVQAVQPVSLNSHHVHANHKLLPGYRNDQDRLFYLEL